MKNSKAFTLLSGLPEKEKKHLSAEIKAHKRKSLVALFKLLANADLKEQPENHFVYKIIFKKSYAKKNDYLLRNEYRLLFEWLEDRICEDTGIHEQQKTICLLKKFLQWRIYPLFEDEFKLRWQNAIKADDVTLLLQLSDVNIQYYLSGKAQSLHNAEMLIQLSAQRMALLKTHFLREIRKEEIRIKMGERVLAAYKPDSRFTEPLDLVSLKLLQEGDLFVQYLSLRAVINKSNGQQKINLLHQVLSNQTIIDKYEPEPKEAVCRFLINLAQEYYLLADFENAVKFYQRAYELEQYIALHVKETLVINYIMALLRNENFETASKLCQTHEAMLLNSTLLSGRSPFLIAVLHLHARQADKAEKFVRLETRKDGTEFYYFMRMVLSAVYYLRKQTDLALRETVNIDQAVNYELQREDKQQTQISKPIVSVFRKFYATLLNTTKDRLREELSGLQQEIFSALKNNNNQSPNSILTQWLHKEIDQLVNRKR